MSAATNSLNPRSAIPADIGERVRTERGRLGWSQDRLARKVGATPWTIMRIERGDHLPTSRLVHALQVALDLPSLVKGWVEVASPDGATYGARVRRARRAAGGRLTEVAGAAGVSAATLSRFERGLCRPTTIVAEEGSAEEGVHAVRLARALGFAGLMELNAYCTGKLSDIVVPSPLPERGRA